MQEPQEDANPPLPNHLSGAILFLTMALRKAATYSPTEPDHGRASVRMALVGVIEFLSELYPDKPFWVLPLNQLLYGLDDLDRGQVVPLLEAVKVANRPKNSLNDNLFRAIAAAAMTRLMDPGMMKREGAAGEIAKRLAKMGYKQPSGKAITARQVANWREKMETELASADIAAARYKLALEWVKQKPANAAVEFLLESIPSLSPPNFPKKPPS